MISSLQRVRDFWDRSHVLSIDQPNYRSHVLKLLNAKLKLDQAHNDITSSLLLTKNKQCVATVRARQAGVIAGIEEVSLLLKNFDVDTYVTDGATVRSHDPIMSISGSAHQLLGIERTLLNVLSRMSGIATATNQIVSKVGKYCAVAATRKTTLELLDKKAVSVGGGMTHRLNLSDRVMVKDNHRLLCNNNIGAMIARIESSKHEAIEIEVDGVEMALDVIDTIPQATEKQYTILLDNFSPADIKKVIKANSNTSLLFEASGSITQNNCMTYAKSGVDIISLGSVTHGAPALDIGLDID